MFVLETWALSLSPATTLCGYYPVHTISDDISNSNACGLGLGLGIVIRVRVECIYIYTN